MIIVKPLRGWARTPKDVENLGDQLRGSRSNWGGFVRRSKGTAGVPFRPRRPARITERQTPLVVVGPARQPPRACASATLLAMPTWASSDSGGASGIHLGGLTRCYSHNGPADIFAARADQDWMNRLKCWKRTIQSHQQACVVRGAPTGVRVSTGRRQLVRVSDRPPSPPTVIAPASESSSGVRETIRSRSGSWRSTLRPSSATHFTGHGSLEVSNPTRSRLAWEP